MSIILAIDTSQVLCSVAIIDSDEKIYYEESAKHNSHSEVLFSLIDAVFIKSGYNYGTIESIVVVVGPGSFTGIRAGVAAAYGIKISAKKKLYGISNMEMQAYLTLQQCTERNKNIKTVFHAYNNSTYAQIFDCNLTPITELVAGNIVNDSQFIKCDNISNIKLNARIAGLTMLYKLKNCLPVTEEVQPLYLDIIKFCKLKDKI